MNWQPFIGQINIERKIIQALIHIPIPDYIKGDSEEQIYLLECYEIGFMFAHDLLDNHKIDPRFSLWGDGESVIFDEKYTELLQTLLKSNISNEMNTYCQLYLVVLDVFKAHFV